jgi:hypothetical protein
MNVFWDIAPYSSCNTTSIAVFVSYRGDILNKPLPCYGHVPNFTYVGGSRTPFQAPSK